MTLTPERDFRPGQPLVSSPVSVGSQGHSSAPDALLGWGFSSFSSSVSRSQDNNQSGPKKGCEGCKNKERLLLVKSVTAWVGRKGRSRGACPPGGFPEPAGCLPRPGACRPAEPLLSDRATRGDLAQHPGFWKESGASVQSPQDKTEADPSFLSKGLLVPLSSSSARVRDGSFSLHLYTGCGDP